MTEVLKTFAPSTWNSAAFLTATRIWQWPRIEYTPTVDWLDEHIDKLRDRDVPRMSDYLSIGRCALHMIEHTEKLPLSVSWFADMVCGKQHDYGVGNILKFGHVGLAVRMSDKIERIKNLVKNGGATANEPMTDSFVDLIGYSTIGIMLIEDTFELPLEMLVIGEPF